MALTVFCQKCGKRFDLDERMAGRRARCKQCQHEVIPPGRRRPAGSPMVAAARSPHPAAPPPSAPRSPPPRPAPPEKGPPVHDPFGLQDSAENPYLFPLASREEEVLP